MTKARINEQMVKAGVAAALEQLPIEVFNERSIDPAGFVIPVFQAMARREWQHIETAPRSGVNLMLGLAGPSGFKEGIGLWVDAEEDDDSGAGNWSTESWWGKPPTHWRPMPPPPPETA